MNLKNFRVGNLVKYKDQVFRIHSITDDFPILDTDKFGIGVVGWNDIEHIKLTKDFSKNITFHCNEQMLYRKKCKLQCNWCKQSFNLNK